MLKDWKDHKFILFSHEFWRPFLAVWMFFRDILMYVFDLFKMSWSALPSAINKNAVIPSFIASTTFCMIIYFCWFIAQILLANDSLPGDFSSLVPWIVILSIILTLPMCWGFATVASVIKAKNKGADDSWRKHTSVGFKGVRFFMTYVLAVVGLFLAITILSSIGLMPMVGKPLLALLAVPFYFASMVIVLCTIGLTVGSFLFGGFYLSGDYDETANFKDKTISLVRMVGSKFVDFVAVQIPASVMMYLFVILPVLLMVSAVTIMQLPGKDFYDIRWPNVYTMLSNTNQYPAENEEENVDMLDLTFSTEYSWMYPTVEAASKHFGGNSRNTKGEARKLQDKRKEYQDQYKGWQERRDYDNNQPNKGKDFGEYVDYLNEYAGSEVYSYSGDQLILLEEPASMPGESFESFGGYDDATCYVSPDEIECTEIYDSNHIWSMDGAGKDVSFGGEYHPSFFIWLITLILVFVCSIVVSVPLGCLYSAGGAIFYNLYISDYNKKYGLIKRLLSLLLLPFFISFVSGMWFMIL